MSPDNRDEAIEHLRESPGVRVSARDDPHDPRDVYDVYIDLHTFPSHEMANLYDAGFEMAVDFTESKLILAQSFDSIDPDDIPDHLKKSDLN